MTNTKTKAQAVNRSMKEIREFLGISGKNMNASMARFIKLQLSLAYLEGRDRQLERDERRMAKGATEGMREVLHQMKQYRAATRLYNYIKKYESDTFSASGEKITPRQIALVTAKLIDNIKMNLDGVYLSNVLGELRGKF